MDLIITAGTDQGSERNMNQDSLLARQLRVEKHHVAAVIISDGMGGEIRGDLGSACVVKSFETWVDRELPVLIKENANRDRLRSSWKNWLDDLSRKLYEYGRARAQIVGATASALLIIDDVYYILNVGDSRVYKISAGKIKQITEDQTIMALAVRRGDLTEEEAANDTSPGILAQAVGMRSSCTPDLYAGRISGSTMFLLCTDGFRHKVFSHELQAALDPDKLAEKGRMKKKLEELIELNRKRGETDNISAILVKAY